MHLSARVQFPPLLQSGQVLPGAFRDPQLSLNFLRGLGHEGGDEDGDKAKNFEKLVQNRIQAPGFAGVLGQGPGGRGVDVFVGLVDEFPDGDQGLVEAEVREHLLRVRGHL